jgi:hypothetical protein
MAHVVGSLLVLTVSPVDFFSWSSIYQSLGPFDVQKVLESKKTCKNMKIYFVVLKRNERGLFRKPPKSMEN